VALRTARESRSREIRRRQLERRGANMQPTVDGSPECPLIRAEEAEALHGEIARLPERYRGPIVLCDLEGLTHQEAASRLRCPVGTVAIRVKRARERLRARLTRRGVDPTAGLMVAGPGSFGNFPIPSSTLIEATVRASTTAGLASASVVSLAEGAQMTMTIAKWRMITAGAAIALGMAATWSIAGGPQAKPDDKPAPAAPSWKVEKAVVREVRDFEEYNGVTGYSRSEWVRLGVDGKLEKALVEVGARVKAGDVLFEFDSTAYSVAVEQASAELASAKAQDERAKAVKARNDRLKAEDPKLVSTEEIEKAEAELTISSGYVARANANEKRAKALLEATKVRAPSDGIIAAREVVVGNWYERDQILAQLVDLDPIAFEFNVDERTLLKIRRAYGDDKKVLKSLPIRITFVFSPNRTLEARLESIADRLDPATATALFRATAPNPDRLAKAGMLFRVRLTTGPPRQALVVPASAIVRNDQGSIVYEVDDQDIIRERTVKLGQPLGEIREIRDGLEPGDRVLTGDLKGVQPGTPLKP
jgi:RND family efflux transporter MFP subunit